MIDPQSRRDRDRPGTLAVWAGEGGVHMAGRHPGPGGPQRLVRV